MVRQRRYWVCTELRARIGSGEAICPCLKSDSDRAFHAASTCQFAGIFETAVRGSGQLPNMWRLFGMSATSARIDVSVLPVEHSKVYFGYDFVQCIVESAAGAFWSLC